MRVFISSAAILLNVRASIFILFFVFSMQLEYNLFFVFEKVKNNVLMCQL